MRKAMACFLLLGVVFACGGQSPVDNTRVTSGGKQLQAPKTAQSTLVARELLTAEMVADAFGVEPDLIKPTAAPQKDKRCSYVWPKPNQEEIDKTNQELMMTYTKEMMEAQQKGEERPKMKFVNSDATVFFNYLALKGTGQAEKAFQENLENLKEGVTVESGDYKRTFKIDYDQMIDDVGSQAAWSSSKRQLAVQQGRYLLYLNLDTQEKAKDELPFAKSLMADIVDKI